MAPEAIPTTIISTIQSDRSTAAAWSQAWLRPLAPLGRGYGHQSHHHRTATETWAREGSQPYANKSSRGSCEDSCPIRRRRLRLPPHIPLQPRPPQRRWCAGLELWLERWRRRRGGSTARQAVADQLASSRLVCPSAPYCTDPDWYRVVKQTGPQFYPKRSAGCR